MKRAMSLSLVLLMASASPAMADDATVDAQVTVATTCITVDPTSIDYGTLTFEDGRFLLSSTGPGATSFTNCSTQREDVYVRGTDASSTTSGATWTLGSRSSSLSCDTLNVYEHSVWDRSLTTSSVGLTAENALLSDAVASSTVRDVGTTLHMPCTGSDGAGETFTFSIIFTAVGG